MRGRTRRCLLIILILLPAAFPAFCGGPDFDAELSLAYPGFWRGMQPSGIDTLAAETGLGIRFTDIGLRLGLNTRNSLLWREEPFFSGAGDLYQFVLREDLPLKGWILNPGFGLYTNIYSSIIYLEYGSLVLEPFIFIKYSFDEGFVEWELILDTTPAQTGIYHGFNISWTAGPATLISTIHWASDYLKQDGGNFIEELLNLRPAGMLISLIPIEFYAGAELPYRISDGWILFGRGGFHLSPYRSYNFNSISLDLCAGIRVDY